MKRYDVIVIGSGVGLSLAFKAVAAGRKVALIERGPLGGTCLNVGCVPSKMLIYPADLVQDIREARRLGIRAQLTGIDFAALMARMRRTVTDGQAFISRALRAEKKLDWYRAAGRFTAPGTLRAGKNLLRGETIFIANGSRPDIPPLAGLAGIDYLTNESVLDLGKLPGSLIIIGGGYIGVEYAHFFAAMGTKVTILQSKPRLVPHEEPEISDLLARELGKRMSVRLGVMALGVRRAGRGVAVRVGNAAGGRAREIMAERVMLAVGRRSNADLLRVGEAGIDTDARGFILVNEFLETSAPGIYALGDVIGRQMFTHAGDREAEIAWHNATHRTRTKMDFDAVPHAVFTRPPLASVGLTEEQARARGPVLIGRATYADTVKGEAMGVTEGFAKAVVDRRTGRLLGFHLIGPDAPILIQEAVNALAHHLDLETITSSMHIFPALTELVPDALGKLEPRP